MGQSLSATKKIRAVHKDAQQSYDLRESFEQGLSPHVESAALLLNSKEATLPSSFTEAASEDLQISLDLEREKVPIKLADLPTEIILDVAEYMALSGQISLSYSCRQIRKKMGAPLTHILTKEEPMASLSDSALSVESRNIRSLERLELRSMLDRDGRIPSSKRLCVGCEAAHDSSLFPILSLKQLSTERRCLGSAGRVWICPHQTVDYDQAANSKEATENHNCENIFVALQHSSRSSRYRSADFSSCTFWPIVVIRGECVPSRERVKEALGPLNAPVCPHLRLNDARIAQFYLPDCQRLRCGLGENGPAPECGCWLCSSEWRRFRTVCDFCGTQLVFYIKEYGDIGMEAVYLVLRRSIQDVRSPTDRSWICQVADPADIEAYERAWHATAAECWKKVGSVFEACVYQS